MKNVFSALLCMSVLMSVQDTRAQAPEALATFRALFKEEGYSILRDEELEIIPITGASNDKLYVMGKQNYRIMLIADSLATGLKLYIENATTRNGETMEKLQTSNNGAKYVATSLTPQSSASLTINCRLEGTYPAQIPKRMFLLVGRKDGAPAKQP